MLSEGSMGVFRRLLTLKLEPHRSSLQLVLLVACKPGRCSLPRLTLVAFAKILNAALGAMKRLRLRAVANPHMICLDDTRVAK